MGRNAVFDKSKFVHYDKATNTSTCLSCQRIMSGNLTGNIKRHYRKLHNLNLNIFSPPPITQNENDVEGGVVRGARAHKRQPQQLAPSLQLKRLRESPQVTVTVNFSKDEFLTYCLGLVTVNKMPLSIFDNTEFFKPLIAPYENAFNVNLNSNILVDMLQQSSQQITEQLKQNLQGKLLALQLDVVHCSEDDFLIVDAQYMQEMDLIFQTLAIAKLEDQSNSKQIKQQIKQSLKSFDISTLQIYTCTVGMSGELTDAVAELQEELQEIKEFVVAIKREDEADELIERTQVKQQSVLTVIRPAQVIIQLTVQNAFRIMLSQLEDCQQIVCNLKKTSGAVKSTLPQLVKAPLDDWVGTIDMLNSLSAWQEAITSGDVEYSEHIDWTFIGEVLEAYQPMLECWQAVQVASTRYIVGDFYRDWLMCEAKLERMSQNSHARILLAAMQHRKKELLEQPAVLAALYVDPRYNYRESRLLNVQQKQVAMTHIMRTNALLEGLCDDQSDDHSSTHQNNTKIQVAPDDPFDLLETKINDIVSTSTSSSHSMDCDMELQLKLDALSHEQRKPFSTNVPQHWQESTHWDADMMHVVDVTLLPAIRQMPTQLNAKTISETLKSDSRFAQDSQLLIDFLFVKSNHKLLNNISSKIQEGSQGNDIK